jgi:hypothetical protein
LLNVPEDTLLVGQPILAEVWLTNVSDHDVFDQLLLESVDRRLRVYAVCPGVGVLDLDPGRRRTMISPGYFRIQPGGSARTLTAIGNLDISARTRSTGFVAPQQFFDSPGWYRLFATYDRGVPGPRCRGDGETLRIMSSVDSFFVRLPSGVDALVYEAALADLEETDLGALERTCEENPSSVYTPYLLAIRAHRLRYDSGRSDRFIRSAEALEHLVKTYPDHILRELVEFDMALYMGIGGQAGRANSRLEKLMVMYPGNPMAYIRFAPDGSSKSLEDLTIRGGQNESGTALE